jgi:putative transposase
VCLLIAIGVREDGCKELVAVEDGLPRADRAGRARSAISSAEGLNESKLVDRDGALSAWGEIRAHYPAPGSSALRARDRRLPNRLQTTTMRLLNEIIEPATRADARRALEVFRGEYPQALSKLDRDWKTLTAFCDYPPSTGGTHRPPTRSRAGSPPSGGGPRSGPKTAAPAMAYKLLE